MPSPTPLTHTPGPLTRPIKNRKFLHRAHPPSDYTTSNHSPEHGLHTGPPCCDACCPHEHVRPVPLSLFLKYILLDRRPENRTAFPLFACLTLQLSALTASSPSFPPVPPFKRNWKESEVNFFRPDLFLLNFP